MTKTRATITGWGKCVPPVKLTNADLEQMVDTSDQWIVERTGMRERRISHVEVTDLAEVAAKRALAAAGLEPTDIDLLVLATVGVVSFVVWGFERYFALVRFVANAILGLGRGGEAGRRSSRGVGGPR